MFFYNYTKIFCVCQKSERSDFGAYGGSRKADWREFLWKKLPDSTDFGAYGSIWEKFLNKMENFNKKIVKFFLKWKIFTKILGKFFLKWKNFTIVETSGISGKFWKSWKLHGFKRNFGIWYPSGNSVRFVPQRTAYLWEFCKYCRN